MENLSPLNRFLIEYRGFFVVLFVVPLSLLYDCFFKARAWAIQKFYSAPELHRERVKRICAAIRAYNEDTKLLQPSEKKKLCTARGGWESISPGYRDYKKKSQCIAINLYDVLEFDDGRSKPHVTEAGNSSEAAPSSERRPFVRVEPMVTMGMLSHYLIPKGFTLPVLPEMDDLTVGGLFMGVGIEASSHLYGLFNDIVLEAEVILASGDVVVCSKTMNRELFDALPWSYGTLGFLASVKLLIVPCKPYVRLEYYPALTRKNGLALIERFSTGKSAESGADKSNRTPEFVEALMYSEQEMVVMKGDFADLSEMRPGEAVNSIGWWYKPWFYKHVESFLKRDGAKFRTAGERRAKDPAEREQPSRVEFIPLREYYHRHTRSIFWELDLILQPFNGNHPAFRFLLGWALPPKVSFLKLTQTKATQEMYEREHVIQDMLVPLGECDEGLGIFHRDYDIYPLWIAAFRLYDYGSQSQTPPHGKAAQSEAEAKHRCFLRRPQNANLADAPESRAFPLSGGKRYEMYLDLGAYGVPRAVLEKKPFDIVATSRSVEQWVAQKAGFQMLYADSYLERDEFRAMFDHTHYEAMKRRYDPTGSFPEVYDKVSVKVRKRTEEKKRD